jgi:hypothetical protein
MEDLIKTLRGTMKTESKRKDRTDPLAGSIFRFGTFEAIVVEHQGQYNLINIKNGNRYSSWASRSQIVDTIMKLSKTYMKLSRTHTNRYADQAAFPGSRADVVVTLQNSIIKDVVIIKEEGRDGYF